MARGKDFDNLVKSESGRSYYDSIPNQGTVMKKWSVYVEPIIEDNANIQVDMTGQEGSSCCCCVII